MMHISDHITDLNIHIRRISSDIIVKGQADYKLCINGQIICYFLRAKALKMFRCNAVVETSLTLKRSVWNVSFRPK